MRRHKILGDYCEQATALFCSQMRTCSTVADVSNLETDSGSIQNVHQKRSKWRRSQHIPEAEPALSFTGSRLKMERSEPAHQMLRAMATLHSCPPAKPVFTGKRVDELRGNESHQIKSNCSKSITLCSKASFVVRCST